MMIITCRDLQQDTIPHKTLTNLDSINGKHDSVPVILSGQVKDSVRHHSVNLRQNLVPNNSDTISVCTRNDVSDVTFHDFNNFIHRLGFGNYRQFPYVFIDKANEMQKAQEVILMKHLKPGKELPPNLFRTDWMIIIILVATFLFSLVRSNSRRMMTYFERTFIFMGKHDSAPRDLSGVFHWQSTVLNLISFFIIGLFGYSVAAFYNFIPLSSKGVVNWIIVLGIITSAVTVRHLVCVLTGAVSGQQEVFREYLLGIYHSYRFAAIFLFVFIVLMSYTEIFPVQVYILSGIFIMGIVYLIRVIRLLIIFLNRNISIFYLILYLCALEILPVLIIVKYFTGLV